MIENVIKDILGYEGLYAVTEDGKVWSYPKRVNSNTTISNICNNKTYQFNTR